MTIKEYLGDSVYCDLDPAIDPSFASLILTTENGYPDDPRNRIVLETDTIKALERYLDAMRKAGAIR